MTLIASRLLRVVLVALLLGMGLAQFLVPVYASQVGTSLPEVADLVVPYSLAAILFIGCGQVALLAAFPLLSLVDRRAVFTRRAVGWVDVIVACTAVATLLNAAVLVHVRGFAPGGGGPMGSLFLTAGLAYCLSLALLTVVVRGVLVSEIEDRTKPDAAS